MDLNSLTEKDRVVLAHVAKARSALYERIKKVHKRPLHAGQIQLAKAYFEDKKKVIMAQYGRGAGKTESILFISWMRALMEPGSIIYIICPERKQGKEIYWASGRLQNYGPPEYLDDAKSSELRCVFKNGSFIAVDGCENLNALRGVKPNLVLYDEFQQHSKEFDQEVMRPNLGTKDAALVICGTPPKKECYYTEYKKGLQAEILAGDDTRAYFTMPSSVNPAWDKKELEKIRLRLIAQGDEAIYRREYLGEDCLGGAEMVFPLWSLARYSKDRAFLKNYLAPDRSKLKWIVSADPGTTTCFGVLFCCYNPYACQFFILDEIYEKDRKKMDTRSMWNQIKAKQEEWNPGGTWRRIADEAAAWFIREMAAQFRIRFGRSRKNKNKKEDQVSLMKMMMVDNDTLFANQDCQWFDWELKNCVTEEDGSIKDENNHLIDAWEYALGVSGFKFIQKAKDEQSIIIPSSDGLREQKLATFNIKPQDLVGSIADQGSELPETDWWN